MAKIYISSTYEDLKEERKAAAQAFRRLGHQAIAMEDYAASDKRPAHKCLKDVRNCDVYVGIFAWRYGFIPGGYDQSMTHLEYKAAKKAGKRCLIFLLDKKTQWPVEYVDTGKERVKIDQLREELQKKHIVSFFANADQLGSLVSAAISNIFTPPLKEPEPEQTFNKEGLSTFLRKKVIETPREKWILAAVLFIVLLSVAVLSNYQFIKKQFERSFKSTLTTDNLTAAPSIAVLPFKDISPDQQQEYFCDGMVEELIIALGRIEGLRVVSRTASFQLKGKDIDVREIGKKLSVKTVLEGSVRKGDNMLIVTTRLINVSDGYQLWGEKYQEKLKNIVTGQL
jgi:TolB-like protein